MLLHYYGNWLAELAQSLEYKSNAQIKSSTFSNTIGENEDWIDEDIRDIFMIFEVRNIEMNVYIFILLIPLFSIIKMKIN